MLLANDGSNPTMPIYAGRGLMQFSRLDTIYLVGNTDKLSVFPTPMRIVVTHIQQVRSRLLLNTIALQGHALT